MRRSVHASRATTGAVLGGALALVLAWWGAAGHATSVLDTSLARMLELAEIGAYGEIADVRQVREDDVTRTEFDLEVERLLIGEREDDAGPLTLSFLGDVTGEDGSWIEDVPRPEAGARVLILAFDDPELASPLVGVWQGWWRLGPEGLSDARDRRLTPSDAGVRRDGEGGSVDEVLDLLAEGTTAPPDTEAAPPDGESEGEGEVEPDTSRDDAEGAPPEENEEASEGSPPDDEPAGPDAAGEPQGDEEPDPDENEDGDEAATPDVVVRLRPPDEEGLQRALEAAAEAWRSAGAPMRLVFDDEAEDVMRPGPASWFSPGALSLSRRAEGGRGVEILLRPGSEGRRSDVLAYELGRLAGAPRLEEGVLSGGLPRDEGGGPGPEEADALRDAAERIPGDFDGDGVVDLYDLARLAERYGESGTRIPEDLDGSGVVDDADLRILRESYEFLPPAREPPETD